VIISEKEKAHVKVISYKPEEMLPKILFLVIVLILQYYSWLHVLFEVLRCNSNQILC